MRSTRAVVKTQNTRGSTVAANHDPVVWLRLSEKERRVLLEALDCLTRIHLGQFRTAFDPAALHIAATSNHFGGQGTLHDVIELLEQAQETFTGSRHGGPSIGNPAVSNDARIARRLAARLETPDPKSKLILSLYDEDGNPTD